jgi:hypothetical protein
LPGFTCGAFGDGIVVDVVLTDFPPTTANVVVVEPFDLGIVATEACPRGTVEEVVDVPVWPPAIATIVEVVETATVVEVVEEVDVVVSGPIPSTS